MRNIFAVVVLALASLMGTPAGAQQVQLSAGVNPTARQGGTFYAASYATWAARIVSGNSSTGSGTSITVTCPGSLADNTTPACPTELLGLGGLNPILVNDNNSETVTPTSISFATCPSGNIGFGSQNCATITGTFNNTHGAGAVGNVISGTYGLQEAINVAAAAGGGLVVVDSAWTAMGGTSAMISAAIVFPSVAIEDVRAGVPRFWSPTPTGLALAVPTTLTSQAACDATHTFCSDATVAGSASYAGGSLFGCVAYVDIMGNEGPCSLTATFTDVSTKAIDVGAPAASPGAVGYVVYLSLDAGTYAQAYQIPSTSSNCQLTTLEIVLPACKVANATYGQTASTFGAGGLFSGGGSQIATYPVNTGLHFTKLASTVQTTVSLTPMTNSSVTYAYAPSNRVGGCPGMSSWNATQEIAAGGISASSSTGIPMSMGTWTIPASCFNYIGAEFRVSGKIVETASGASDALKVIVAWDAPGTNTTTVPTTLCNIANTHTEAGAQQSAWYSCTVRILTTGATGTALVNGGGFFDIATGAAGVLIGGANDTAVAASGSINLTASARISVRFSNTGSTVTAAQPLEGTLEFVN